MALKQWSQLQTLSIQCLDIRTAGRVTKPAGATVADHRTYAASSAAGVSAPRHGATASTNAVNASTASRCDLVEPGGAGVRPAGGRVLLDGDLPWLSAGQVQDPVGGAERLRTARSASSAPESTVTRYRRPVSYEVNTWAPSTGSR